MQKATRVANKEAEVQYRFLKLYIIKLTITYQAYTAYSKEE